MSKKLFNLVLAFVALFLIGNTKALAQSPGGVSGASQWYKNTGATSTQWADASGNGNNVPALTNVPTFTRFINFNPVATFSGNQGYMRATALTNGITTTGGATSFYVASTSTLGLTFCDVHGQGFVQGLNSGRYGARLHAASVDGNYAFDATIPNAWALNIPKLVRAGYSSGATSNSYVSDNGGTEVVSGATTARTLTTQFAIGATYSGAGYFWTGDIAEIVIYPS